MQTETDSFWKRIDETFEASLDRFERSAAIRRILAGDLRLDHYVACLREFAHYTRGYPAEQAAMTLYFEGAQRRAIRRMLGHAASEVDHDLLARRDLEALGISTDDFETTRPLPSTMPLIALPGWHTGRGTVRAIQRLWYEVLVVERGAGLPGTDHRRRLVDEPLTRAGNLFVARREDVVVGALNSLYAGRDDLDNYPDWFPGRWTDGCSLSVRMVTARAHRDGTAALALARATYRQGLLDGIEQDFADTYRRGLPFFRRLGYRSIPGPTIHPVFGPCHAMRLDLRDRQHLVARRSRFLADLDAARPATDRPNRPQPS